MMIIKRNIISYLLSVVCARLRSGLLVLHAWRRCGKNHSKIKTMLTVFFDWEDVHHEYVPPGQTINKNYYLNVLYWLNDAIWQNWPQLWATGGWQLNHNAPAYASCLVQFFCETITQVTQPPYRPNLAPWDFWLFPKLKSPFRHWWDSRKSKAAADGDSNKGFCSVFWTVEKMLGELGEVLRCLLWRGLRRHCPMYNVSCIFFNKHLYFP